jgi:hypothetical protein
MAAAPFNSDFTNYGIRRNANRRSYPQIYLLDPLTMLTRMRMLTRMKGRNAVKLTPEERELFKKVGALGGKTSAKNLGKDGRKARASKAAAGRWKGHKKKDR